MTHPRAFSSSLSWGVCVAAPFLLSACAATDTGNPIDGNAGGDDVIEGVPIGGECELATRELEWDEDWGPGFSAADVAAHLPEQLTTSLRFFVTSTLSYGPESGFGELELAFAPRERAYVVAPKSSGDDDGPMTDGPPAAYGPECARMLNLESEVTLRSSGGALDDTFLVLLQTRAFADTVHTHFRVSLDALRGSLEADLELPPGQTLVSLELEVELWLAPPGVTGALRIAPSVEDEDGVPVDTSPIALGQFPAEQRCGLGAYFLEGEQTLRGFSPAEVVSRLLAASGAEWTYEHQSGTTNISWSLPGAPVSGCVDAEQTGIEFLTPLVIESSDGSVDGTFMVNVYAMGDGEGNFNELQMAGGSYEQYISQAVDLGERYGITEPASLDGYEHAMTDFVVNVTDEPWGIFRYAGLNPRDCAPPYMCREFVPTVLFGARLGEPKNGYED